MKIIYALLLSFIATTAFAADLVAPQASSPKKIPQAQPPQVQLHTSAGDITLLLNPTAAPVSVANFLQYVNEGFYNNTLFHRVIPDFMIQGGGFQTGMVEKAARKPIVNESSNGLKNKAGTIAMARTQNPDSATAQFFINVVDNAYLDASGSKSGYAVFGTVSSGMDVVQKIAQTKTGQSGMYGDVPVQDVIIISAKQLP